MAVQIQHRSQKERRYALPSQDNSALLDGHSEAYTPAETVQHQPHEWSWVSSTAESSWFIVSKVATPVQANFQQPMQATFQADVDYLSKINIQEFFQ